MPPITRAEASEFTATWKKLRTAAKELCRLQNHNERWSPEGLHDVTDRGLEFYDMVPEDYGGGHEIKTRLVTWADLLDYESAFADATIKVNQAKKEQAKKALDWEREQYERLAKKYGKETK